MDTRTYPVTGLTCGHCVSAVTEEISAIPGVSQADVSLVAGGTSTLSITAREPLARESIVAALDEAGDYRLADSPA